MLALGRGDILVARSWLRRISLAFSLLWEVLGDLIRSLVGVWTARELTVAPSRVLGLIPGAHRDHVARLSARTLLMLSNAGVARPGPTNESHRYRHIEFHDLQRFRKGQVDIQFVM